MQWGTTSFKLSNSRGSQLVTFPIAFPQATLHISGSCYGINGTASVEQDSVIFSARFNSNANAWVRSRHIASNIEYTVDLMWIALGV